MSIKFLLIAFDHQEKSLAGIDRDAMRFQGLEQVASISHDKPRHCAAVTQPSSTRKHRSNAPTKSLIIASNINAYSTPEVMRIKDMITQGEFS